jgi:hypothetical protein
MAHRSGVADTVGEFFTSWHWYSSDQVSLTPVWKTSVITFWQNSRYRPYTLNWNLSKNFTKYSLLPKKKNQLKYFLFTTGIVETGDQTQTTDNFANFRGPEGGEGMNNEKTEIKISWNCPLL